MKKKLIPVLLILASGCAELSERLNYGHVVQMKEDAKNVQQIMETKNE